MLAKNPAERITAEQVLNSKWIEHSLRHSSANYEIGDQIISNLKNFHVRIAPFSFRTSSKQSSILSLPLSSIKTKTRKSCYKHSGKSIETAMASSKEKNSSTYLMTQKPHFLRQKFKLYSRSSIQMAQEE
jgi:hypothetical protein